MLNTSCSHCLKTVFTWLPGTSTDIDHIVIFIGEMNKANIDGIVGSRQPNRTNTLQSQTGKVVEFDFRDSLRKSFFKSNIGPKPHFSTSQNKHFAKWSDLVVPLQSLMPKCETWVRLNRLPELSYCQQFPIQNKFSSFQI